MPQSLSRILLHVVFSTKNHENTIPAAIAPSFHAYLAGACRKLDCHAYRVGGTANHVHIACSLARTMSVSGLLEGVKKTASSWMKVQKGGHRKFSWQAGYGAFSIGQSQLATLVQYIDNQVEHHRKQTFQEELLAFLKRYEVEYDRRYIWG